MTVNIAQIKAFRRTNYVNRLAGHAMNTSYSVTEHQGQAAILYIDYCRTMGVAIDAELLAFIVAHDALEVFTGDLLLPAKKLAPSAWDHIEQLVVQNCKDKHGVDYDKYSDSFLVDEDSKKIWKSCDLTELYCKCVDEYNLGNRSSEIKGVLRTAKDIIYDLDIDYFTEIVRMYDPIVFLSMYTNDL